MKYLHKTEIKSHGNLKSANCVVDSRWVLKITDFSIQTVRKVTEESSGRMEQIKRSKALFQFHFCLDFCVGNVPFQWVITEANIMTVPDKKNWARHSARYLHSRYSLHYWFYLEYLYV